MHVELSPKYKEGISNLIQNLKLNSHLSNSFNASGETIILSSSKDELHQLLEAEEGDFKNNKDEGPSAAVIEGLKAIIKEQLK